MNTDFRVAVTFVDHPKTLQLVRALGPAGVYGLLRLWSFAATQRPDGNLRGLTDAEIDEIARVPQFTLNAHRTGWLNGRQLSRNLHDWSDHNGYASAANRRSQAARENATKRWKDNVSVGRSTSIDDAAAHAPADAAASRPDHAPSPSPVPSPALRSPSENSSQEQTPKPPSRRSRRSALSSATPDYPDGFLRAWRVYPHNGTRSGKQESAVVWGKLGLESLTDSVLAWIDALKGSPDWTKDGGQFVPGMQVWLKKPDFAEAPPRASGTGFLGMSAQEERDLSRILGESYDD